MGSTVELRQAAKAWARHKREGGVFTEEIIPPSAWNNGAGHDLAMPADTASVLGYLEVDADSPLKNTLVAVVGHRIVGQGEAVLAAQTIRARPDIDLETAADGEATASAKVGLGIVKDPEVPKANAMDFRDEALVDDAVTNRDQIEPLTPEMTGRGGFPRFARSGEYIVLVSKTPPGTSEAYGMDHLAGDGVPVMRWGGD